VISAQVVSLDARCSARCTGRSRDSLAGSTALDPGQAHPSPTREAEDHRRDIESRWGGGRDKKGRRLLDQLRSARRTRAALGPERKAPRTAWPARPRPGTRRRRSPAGRPVRSARAPSLRPGRPASPRRADGHGRRRDPRRQTDDLTSARRLSVLDYDTTANVEEPDPNLTRPRFVGSAFLPGTTKPPR
jgi:hypothetical protein